MEAQPLKADIYLVGLGIFELQQLTVEGLHILKSVKCVYHLTGMQKKLSLINPNTRALNDLYSRPGNRVSIYDDLAAYVVKSAQSMTPIALAIEGNPMFLSDICWKIAALGQEKGLHVEVVPGVSCIDVLPMQLGFEPGDLGFQIFEATQLVLYNLQLNPYLSTLVLQVGYFFRTVTLPPPRREMDAFAPLVDHLTKFFPKDHPVIFVESAHSAESPTTVFSATVATIDEHRNHITAGMTLYIPRIGIPAIQAQFEDQLDSL
jgi:uncharacterized protein YabN with tetrapyrrole methylase and pyrophosphatase domain